jgi:hypothetical protein
LLRFFDAFLSIYGLNARFYSNTVYFSIHLTMSFTPTATTPGLLSVANLLASIIYTTPGVPYPNAPDDLRATQLLFEEDIHMEPTLVKMEKEGDLGTLGFPGGGGIDKGVPLALLSLGNTQDYCLGRIGRDRVCLLQMGLCDVAKHERQKLEVKEPMMYIRTPAAKHTKFAA